MADYSGFFKTNQQLRLLGSRVRRVFEEGHSPQVDIELTIESEYGIALDLVPLTDLGVEGFPSIDGKKIYVDLGLAVNEGRTRRYRFTLAEELSHLLLKHNEVYADVDTEEEWRERWGDVPDQVKDRFDRDARELAGIILIPENELIKRVREIRAGLKATYGIKGDITPEVQSLMRDIAISELSNDFCVNYTPAKIRLGRIESSHRTNWLLI